LVHNRSIIVEAHPDLGTLIYVAATTGARRNRVRGNVRATDSEGLCYDDVEYVAETGTDTTCCTEPV
jgi:hypothetical protein